MTAPSTLLSGSQVGTKGWPFQSNKGMDQKAKVATVARNPNEGTLDLIPKQKHHPLDPWELRQVAGIRSEPWPASSRNGWPASSRNARPASSESADEDRKLVLEHCRACRETNIVITHGTDTMPETARFLGEHEIKNKTVVLVGSFVPFSQERSDAFFNLGYAIASAQCLPPGVWIGIGGEIFSWDNVRKNKDKQIFERIQGR